MKSSCDQSQDGRLSEAQPESRLQLPDLSIQGFRGIKDLFIPSLGRVTLLTGKNGVGKTTVLDAVRIYAARASHASLLELPERREEIIAVVDEDGDKMYVPNVDAIFHGRDASHDAQISIGPSDRANRLRIETATPDDKYFSQFEDMLPDNLGDQEFTILKVVYRDAVRLLPPVQVPRAIRRFRRRYEDGHFFSEIESNSLGPGLPDNNNLTRFWDHVVLSGDEDRMFNTLELVLGLHVDRVAVVGEEKGSFGLTERRVVVRFKGQRRPIPLKSLGDGAVRLFGIALALAISGDGFLLIDEAENGIHHSVQHDFWRMILVAAQENNVQVIATTHGWDCVRGFSQAATELEGVDGALVRLEREGDQIRVVEYSEDELMVAARHGIEVR